MLKAGKESEEIDALNARIKELEEALAKEEGNRKQLETEVAKLVEEKNQLYLNLEKEKAVSAENEERANKLQAQKNDLDRQVGDLSDRLGDMEDRNSDLQRAKKKAEQDIEGLKKNSQDLELSLRKAESEKQARGNKVPLVD